MKIKLYKGDCLELMKSIPDGSIDAIITDPPYGTTATSTSKTMPYNPQGLKDINRVLKNTDTDSLGMRDSRKKGSEYVQTKTGYPRSVLKYSHDNSKLHPTQKPVELMEYLIKTYTNENETVLDFTMGSGSTGVACVNTSRNFIGIEMDENYFNIAAKRIEEAQELNELL